MLRSLLVAIMAYSSVLLADGQQTMGLPEGTIGLAAAAGKVVDVQPLCPKEDGVNCIVDGTIVTLEFTGGCLDSLLPLTYASSESRSEVFVHALVAMNENSRVAFCKRLPVYKAEVTLINQYPPLKFHFMGTQEAVVVQ